MSHLARPKRRARGDSPISRALRPRDDVDLPSPIQTLPSDLLGEVFSYISFSARLKSVSFVCKRWRAAALKSVTRLVLHEHCVEEYVDAVIKLFPSLTALDLRIVPHLCPAALPPSVHWLGVCFSTFEELEYELEDLRLDDQRKKKAAAVEAEEDAEEAEEGAEAEDKDADADEDEDEEEDEEQEAEEEEAEEEESTDYGKYEVSVTKTVRLIARHTQLTSLSLRASGEDAGAAEKLLAPLRLPNLRHLTIYGSFEEYPALIAIAPALQTLKIIDITLEKFMGIKALMAPLVTINVPYHDTEEELAAFLAVARTLPNLKRVKPALTVDAKWNPLPPGPVVVLSSDFRVSERADWIKLRSMTHIDTLYLEAGAPLVDPLPPLPHLKALHLGDDEHLWSWPAVLPKCLSKMLHHCPSIKRVSMWLMAKPRDRLRELVALLVMHGVQEVVFCGAGKAPGWTVDDVGVLTTARAHGWLRVLRQWSTSGDY